jgi:hypothetical protein
MGEAVMAQAQIRFRWKLLTVVGGILSVLFAGLWVRSFFRKDRVGRGWEVRTTRPNPAAAGSDLIDTDAGSWELRSLWGLLVLEQQKETKVYDDRLAYPIVRVLPLTVQWRRFHEAGGPAQPLRFAQHKFLGLSHYQAFAWTTGHLPAATLPPLPWSNPGPISSSGRLTISTVPHWLLVLLTGLPGVVGGWKWHKARRRAREGVCGRCGYDLRAHKAGERCPECGTEIPTVPSATISGKPRSDR